MPSNTTKATKPRPRETVNKANHSMNPDRPKTSAGMRDRSTIKRLQMYRNFKPKRDKSGRIITPAPFQSTLKSGTMARVEPNRKWFGNTRVVTQNALQAFTEAMNKVKSDPYKVVMNPTKNPVTLLSYTPKAAPSPRLLDREPFEKVFGKKATRKRPTLSTCDLDEMVKNAETDLAKWEETQNLLIPQEEGVKDGQLEIVFKAGTSKRIWNELYKVIDSSDVLLQVLDARDPNGTRCRQVENYLKKEKPHKHLIFVLNKADLVPNWAIKKWVAVLSAEHPTLAFRASITNCFGRGDMISLLRQFTKLHNDKKQISVGLIGYPNVGKSSIINALKSKKVCNVAPVPGETKVWQYVTLMNNLFLIDCPGIVYPTGATPTDLVLKGVVRVEKVDQPEDYIHAVLERVKKDYLVKTYGISDWQSPEDFLEQVARKSGRLLRGGEPDIGTVAKNILNDYQRGKIPYFVRPPESELEEEEDDSIPPETEAATDVENKEDDNKVLEADMNTSVTGEDDDGDDEENNDDDIKENKAEPVVEQKASAKTKPQRSDAKTKGKNRSEKGLAALHPFFEATSRKLGDIKKKMAKLRQNIQEIQNKKKARELKKSASEASDVEQSAESSLTATDSTSISQQPQFIKLPSDATQERTSVTCYPSISRKRKLEDAETEMPDSATKKKKQTVQTSSGVMIVSEISSSPAKSTGNTPTIKKTPPASNSSSKQRNKRKREEDEDENTPRITGLLKRRMQRHIIKDMNKKNEFYKETDVKNRRKSRR
ncbi:nucleolar GTP-binding protein 2 [Biomphalaria pfeifferi]|uniref:Nucleolar GTP-binding protein 2 n=1 Tax=Biomphalaria pfeifferi TaxID=112525 RepID=A0AAD8AVW1_BIOPF|nr:nucleolar GTP-binding protein 2 [Biomphalaria pfeifferi]